MNDLNTATDPAMAHPWIEGRNLSFYAATGKRVVDIVIAFGCLPIVAPVTGLLWLIVRLDGGNGFFGHLRVGRDGKTFRCWKLRTMVMDAENRLKDHLEANPAAAAEWARDHKLTDDPRITRIGRFLRKTSLDELPQIVNVLRGDMSFVGPRPIVAPELSKYGRYSWAYLGTRPGVTGIWQVSGRNNVSYDDRVRMDVSYVGKSSMAFDLGVMVRTVGVLFFPNGK